MAYDLTRVQLEFREVCRRAGASAGLTVPIKLNGKLTRTLGRVKHKYNEDRGLYESTLVEFSKQLIEQGTDETIKETIYHEAAHLIATERTGEVQGHNSYFKSICAEIGTSNNGAVTHAKYTTSEDSRLKYTVYCHTCHKNVGGYSRMCATLKQIELCQCKLCRTSNLTYTQNW